MIMIVALALAVAVVILCTNWAADCRRELDVFSAAIMSAKTVPAVQAQIDGLIRYRDTRCIFPWNKARVRRLLNVARQRRNAMTGLELGRF